MSINVLPPFLFPTKSRNERLRQQKLKADGLIRSIGPRLYTSLSEAEVADATRRSWMTIVDHLFPNSLVSHRSALEYKATPGGVIYLTGKTNREIKYPGLTLKFVRGTGAIAGDPKTMHFYVSSLARAFLENLSSTYKDEDSKVLPQREMERRLEEILLLKGEQELNLLRDEAQAISIILKLEKEFERLHRLIGALLGTRATHALESEIGKARAQKLPYDQNVLNRLQLLFGEIRQYPFKSLIEESKSVEHFNNKAFFEAYFSNYIEGTTFEIEEAEAIIFDRKIPENRPKDAHDVLGTYQIVSDPNQMRKLPTRVGELVDYIKLRHHLLMKNRPEAMPGDFKTMPNRAGSTSFVHPDYVAGTLSKGFELYQDLLPGIARGIYIMFLIAEVHPFADGNGRLARIMMNAELYSRQSPTIIIPNVYGTDYVGALRALSRQDRPRPLINALTAAQLFSNLEFSSYPKILGELRQRNWFAEPDDAKIIL
jgi:Fic/DOC family